MTQMNVELTDAALVGALASRASGDHTSTELIAAVTERIETAPQVARWRSALPSSGRLLLAATIGLVGLAAIGAAAIGSRPWDGPNRTSAVVNPTRTTEGETCRGSCALGKPALMLVKDRAFEVVTLDGERRGPSIAVPGVAGAKADPVTVRGPVPVISPDGTMVAYRLYDSEPGIYVQNIDGSDLRVVAATHDIGIGSAASVLWHPGLAWSPDSKTIAYLSPTLLVERYNTRAPAGLQLVNVRDRRVRELVDPSTNGGVGSSFAWSPDGTMIAFARDYPAASGVEQGFDVTSGIVVVNVDGTGERELDSTRSGRLRHVGAVAWSPDGSKISFDRELIPEGQTGVAVVNPDGSGFREVYSSPMHGCCLHHSFGGLARWSPDGSMIATAWADVTVVAADGSGLIRSIPALGWFSWSADGSQILVSQAKHPERSSDDQDELSPQVFAVTVASGDLRWIADGDYPSWIP
jgi:dipeptidyl aminopeptidase/acylaminoacyl peptidase